jgi:hypothetical protein
MRRRGFLALLLPAIGCRSRHTASSSGCAVCRRPVHDSARTIALVGGRQEVFCCPTCAVSARQQRGERVEIVAFSDYAGGWKLDPREAYLVRNSEINPCLHRHGLVDSSKRVSEVHYDRCSPSVLAFRTREAAQQFVAQHGGSILRVGEL